MKTFVSILLWIWQAPQNIVGLVFRWTFGRRYVIAVRHCRTKYFIVPTFPGGISLGATVLISTFYLDNPDGWEHEYGHVKQSLYLGPLYLLVIGIPSLLWAWYWTPARGVSYYSFYTEKWADKLAGIKRDKK